MNASLPSSGILVYLLRCGDGSILVGSTARLRRRPRRVIGPVQLVHAERHPDLPSAEHRERQLRHWPQSRRRALCVRDPR